MKNALIIIFLTLSTAVSATTYYIDPAGKDIIANNGSQGSPWKTLAYACSKVTDPGDIIHVNSGTYFEILQSTLAVGVSIEGEGISSNIISNISKQYIVTILLYSSKEGTNGNQHISNIRMDGDGLTAYGAIAVRARSNVLIHHCEFEDFLHDGVKFTGKVDDSDGEPVTYATGNKFYNNIVTNCADFVGSGGSGDGRGNLCVGGQQDMLIYNNTIIQEDRGANSNGFGIKFAGSGCNKGLKIYNNTITIPPWDGSSWDFAIELFESRGGIEIYNNIIQGVVDFSSVSDGSGITNDAGGYGFAMKIYNNTLGQSVMRTRAEIAIDIEHTQTGGIYIYNNLIKNVEVGLNLAFIKDDSMEDIYFCYNIIKEIGISGVAYKGNAIIIWGDAANTYDNFNFFNNVFYGGVSGHPVNGIRFESAGNATNFNIRNNIIQGFPYSCFAFENCNIDIMSVENNIFYQNGNSNLPRYGNIIPTHYTTQNNIIANPLFVSSLDFHLLDGSNAIGKGLKITGVTTDFDGNTIKNPPTIGAYEYNSTPPTPIIPVYSSSVIENSTPDLLEMTFNVSLTDSIPNASAFTILVDGINRALTSVSILGNKVRLKLADPVEYNNSIFITYTPPSKQPIQTLSRGLAAAITSQPVTNNLLNPANNSPPEVVINYPSTGFSGFVYKLDASGTTDLNNDALTFSWTAPTGIPVSSTDSSIIRFLAPIVVNQTIITFTLDVSDGKAIQSKNLSITINPYKPELGIAKNKIIEASNYNLTDYPQNVDDGNLTTKWSVNGDNQWLLFSLAEPFKISHLQIALLPDQKYESYFDLYASTDNLTWEPVLIKTASCNFSGSLQNFDFPAIKTNIEYSFVKLVGHGNSLNTWNNYSEVKLFGEAGENLTYTTYNTGNITIYPNPASDLINILILEPPAEPQLFRIYDMAGAMRFESLLDPGVNNVQIPINLNSGIYTAEVMLGKLIVFAQKLLVIK